MTKMFEQVVESTLRDKYEDNLFVGEEPKKITGEIKKDVKRLNNINHLLENKTGNKKLDLVFAEKSEINLDYVDQITINSSEAIDIDKCDWEYDELVFDSKIGFIGIKTLLN